MSQQELSQMREGHTGCVRRYTSVPWLNPSATQGCQVELKEREGKSIMRTIVNLSLLRQLEGLSAEIQFYSTGSALGDWRSLRLGL